MLIVALKTIKSKMSEIDQSEHGWYVESCRFRTCGKLSREEVEQLFTTPNTDLLCNERRWSTRG